MSPPDRKEADVRALLRQPPGVPVPADLAARALAQGERLLRRRRVRLALVWVTVLTALLALLVCSLVLDPWSEPPPTTSPAVGR
ncbi:hypothetical protein ACF1DY_32280 [Streptomyces albus]